MDFYKNYLCKKDLEEYEKDLFLSRGELHPFQLEFHLERGKASFVREMDKRYSGHVWLFENNWSTKNHTIYDSLETFSKKEPFGVTEQSFQREHFQWEDYGMVLTPHKLVTM